MGSTHAYGWRVKKDYVWAIQKLYNVAGLRVPPKATGQRRLKEGRQGSGRLVKSCFC